MLHGNAARFAVFALVALGVATCAPAPQLTPAAPNGQEHMPAFASIWLTSEPAAPTQSAKVELSAPDAPDLHRAHTFEAGDVLRGSIPVSSGRYRLVGLGGACAIDLFLGPERETDVVLRIDDDGTCTFTVILEHGEELSHDEPSILVGP